MSEPDATKLEDRINHLEHLVKQELMSRDSSEAHFAQQITTLETMVEQIYLQIAKLRDLIAPDEVKNHVH
jgi:hypothetical protein